MTHYEALELPENASAADIRRAYRRLVLLTHPDRTPDPAAHARYLDVNAAYEVLSDPGRRAAYDFARRTPSVAAPVSPGRARDRARRPAAARRPAGVPFAAQYALTFRLARPVLLGCLLLCFSIGLDSVLVREQPEVVLRTDGVAYKRIVHYTSSGQFTQEEEVPVGTRLWVRRGPLWRTVIAARVAQTGEELAFMTIYQGVGKLVWWCLAFTAACSLQPTFSNEARLMATLSAAFFLLIALVIMFAT